jgi:hypothetical protein
MDHQLGVALAGELMADGQSPCWPDRTSIAAFAAILAPIVYHPEIVLGVLIAILHFDRVTAQRGLAGKRQVTLIVAMGVARRGVAPLPVGGIGRPPRRPSALGSLLAVPNWSHAFDLP